jgi:hypothetical protein
MFSRTVHRNLIIDWSFILNPEQDHQILATNIFAAGARCKIKEDIIVNFIQL